MLDIRYIRENSARVQEAAKQKGYKVDVDELVGVDSQRRELLIKVEEIRKQRNELSESLKKGKPSEEQIKKGREFKADLAKLEDELAGIEATCLAKLKEIPNMPTDDVPIGASEDENVVTKTVGDKPKFDFEVKNHWQLGEKSDWIDKERAAKVAGSRFAYLKGDIVRLHWALLQYAMDLLGDEEVLQQIIAKNNLKVSSKPFVPVLPPYLIRTEPYEAMDRLEPRDDRYKIEGEELWLQGSAEHVLGSMHADEIFDEAEMPVRYIGYTTAFRREAGTYGKDMEGIIRLHQFDKLEMESFSLAEDSLQEHLFMVAIQEHIMQQLNLAYQVIMKCTFDIGKPNARGVDIEAWLPGQDKYRETHTADYMTDYQARRLNTRVRRKNGDLQLVHTNDATVLSQRPLIAILENNQREDGKIVVPEVLLPYIGNRTVLG